jgi:hypothetical protein
MQKTLQIEIGKSLCSTSSSWKEPSGISNSDCLLPSKLSFLRAVSGARLICTAINYHYEVENPKNQIA